MHVLCEHEVSSSDCAFFFAGAVPFDDEDLLQVIFRGILLLYVEAHIFILETYAKLGICYRTYDACSTNINALIGFQLDYFNSILYNVPRSKMDRLQRRQNQCTCILTKLLRSSAYYASNQFIILCCSMRMGQIEVNISEHQMLIVSGRVLKQCYLYNNMDVLRSAESNLLMVPPAKPGKYGSRSFVRASAILWNAL